MIRRLKMLRLDLLFIGLGDQKILGRKYIDVYRV